MGFNWVYVNSFHCPGFSGSLYAVKHHYRVNPDFLPPNTPGDGLDLLEQTLRQFRDLGLWPIMDLVVNHTSRDCLLTGEHPEWYVHDEHGDILRPFVRDPVDPEKITVWGDLAEIDNAGSSDREGLWNYWSGLVQRYLRLGFKGFRCDAAYKVTAELWRHLIEAAQAVNPSVVFFAETLGCAEEDGMALHNAGFHYFFNSSRWWDFEQPWCLEQHEKFGNIAPSISFPESHDTTRLSADTGGNELVQRQRYAFAAVFSAGLMMPIGYEFGFKKRLHVVTTSPADWETPVFDLQGFIARVNRFKLEQPLLHGEGNMQIVTNTEDVLILQRQSDQAPGKAGLILINKSCDKPASVGLQDIATLEAQHRLFRLSRDERQDGEPLPGQAIRLAPAELALLMEP